MITYEYKCGDCGRLFEFRQSITASPLTECPDCHGPVHRIISGGSGFILKQMSEKRLATAKQTCSLQTTGKTCCGLDERCRNTRCDANS